LAFRLSELHDILRVILLINFGRSCVCEKEKLAGRIQKFLGCYPCVEKSDLDESINELVGEGLLTLEGDKVLLTEKGAKLRKEFKSLLFKEEPIIEVVAGLTDGSITSLIVITSAIFAGLGTPATLFAAFLTLAAVSVTNFSSFILGGKTEDIADLINLRTLMEYGLHTIPDKEERDTSLMLIKNLFLVLSRAIGRSNLISATICGLTTFLSGSIPIMFYLVLPPPFNIIISLSFVGVVVGIFLTRYRSRKTKVHWRFTLLETLGLIIVAVIISLLIGGTVWA